MGKFSSKPTLADRVHILEDHAHSITMIAPVGAAPAVVVAGAGAFNPDAYTELIANGAIGNPFDIHHVTISTPSANEDYELILYAVTTEIARVPFTRDNNFVNSIQVAVQTPLLDPGTQVQARLGDGTGGAACGVKVSYHEY